MPANTLVSTSHVANQTLARFIGATLNVFPYQIQQGTVLWLSLYLNSQLVTSQEYDLASFHTTPAVVKTTFGGAANFSDSIIALSVSQIRLNNTYPADTTVTVLTWASNPVWVQIDTAMVTASYETFGITSYSPPSTLVPQAGTVCPYTLSVGVESAAL